MLPLDEEAELDDQGAESEGELSDDLGLEEEDDIVRTLLQNIYIEHFDASFLTWMCYFTIAVATPKNQRVNLTV